MRVANENEQSKKQRAESAEAYEEHRRKKLDRVRNKGVGASVDMVNLFSQLGLSAEYLKDKEAAFQLVRPRLEGRNKDHIPAAAFEYLVSDFGAQVVEKEGNEYIHFPEGEQVSIFAEIAERSGQKQAVVKEVWAAILKTIRINLKRDRKVRVPDLCIIKVDFKPAKPKRKGRSFGKTMTFKAREAENKLRIRPLKKLKVFVANKIPVEKG